MRSGIMWRKRRLRLAESAAHRRALEKSLNPYRETSKAALVHIEASAVSDGAADAVRMSDCQPLPPRGAPGLGPLGAARDQHPWSFGPGAPCCIGDNVTTQLHRRGRL